ncbi:MAG: hypothetical protein RIB30_11150 [Thalassospira sp.]|uniref:hypothetical protein n=1 Tax=Thalassospira sp. TaxID=1912094 RepID=UPI0032EFD194
MSGIKVLYAAVLAGLTMLCPFGASADFVQSDLKADPSGQFYCGDAMEWCFGIAQTSSGAKDSDAVDIPVLLVLRAGKEVTRQEIIQPKSSDDDVVSWRKTGIWPQWVHDPDNSGAFLMGIVTTTSVGYSGGGASVAMLSLIRVDPQSGIAPVGVPPKLDMVATFPWEASKMIRACFSEQDMIDRNQLCHDTYDFTAEIAPVSDVNARIGALPSLHYLAGASKFPPNADLTTDSNTRPVVGEKTMVQTPDPACQLDAVFRFNINAQVYDIDLPLEGCEAYLIP